MIGFIAVADWRIDAEIPLGFLYLFPMLLAGSVLRRWQICIAAALCTVLTECFDNYAWDPASGIPRNILVFSAFFGMGLLVYEMVRNRRVSLEHLNQLEGEMQARRGAEEQLKVLVESSPVAIITTDGNGTVLLANEAVSRLLALPSGVLAGKSIYRYLPSLITIPELKKAGPLMQTVMQCRGRREDGEVFLADVWFSTYRTSSGPRLAAMIVDASEDLRSHEQSSLHQLLAGSRILMGAVSHEIRNVCGAIAVVHENLSRGGALAQNKDFAALGRLIQALENIASTDLKQIANQAATTDLQSLLDELRIVVEPSLREKGIDVHWTLEPDLPAVWADRHSLMQVFLNLIQNSERAMLVKARRELHVITGSGLGRILIQFRDTGGGVPDPELIFRPFQRGAKATGLGLYLSRAFMRSFRGDLKYKPAPEGSIFTVELSRAPVENEEDNDGSRDPNTDSGRSYPLSRKPEPVA